MIHYIYIPGLGDRLDPLRRVALLGWRRRNTVATLVPMHWTSKSETYEEKYARIAKVIQQFDGERIVLVGESAGGAMALLAFSRNLDKVDSVITICGYNQGASDIHVMYRRRNPAFYPLSRQAEKVVRNLSKYSRERITTIYSTLDSVVNAKYSRIDGAREVILHTPGHLLSIGRMLIVGLNRLQ